MKILSAEQIRQADQYTIKNEPIASIDLMERASTVFVEWFIAKFDPKHPVKIFCGTGNNGGDGLAISRLLTDRGYRTQVFVIGDKNKGSADFTINLGRFNAPVHSIESQADFPILPSDAILVDGIFGSGLTRSVEGLYGELINHLNQSDRMRVAIDIPSGLFADRLSSGNIVKADYTISFQLPKLALLLPENYSNVGIWEAVDIGLNQEFIESQDTSYYFIHSADVSRKLKKRSKYDHKGTYGKALIISGSFGKIGAAVLSSRAALRSGLGLLTVHTPGCGYNALQTAVPEAMVITDVNSDVITSITEFNFDAIGLGPGLGKDTKTVRAVADFLEEYNGPLVVDADGLNILSENRELLQLLPENSVLTPHPGEFRRLVGSWQNDFDRLDKQRQFSKDFDVLVALKGAHTSISTPKGDVYFNSTGNPGMATAGSGDALTGIVTALLAQGYQAEDAAISGVYLHGLAGDLASLKKGESGMIATDIIECLPDAFQQFDK